MRNSFKLRSFDLKTFSCIFGAGLIGALLARYNYGKVNFNDYQHYTSGDFNILFIWMVFVTPFMTFWGWLFARRSEGWIASFVCFCIYFFSSFVAARYEYCTIPAHIFNLTNCFSTDIDVDRIARDSAHILYFQAIVPIHLCAVFVVAIQRSLNRPQGLQDVITSSDR